MAGGFGFENYATSGQTPRPEQVGERLLMGQGASQGMPGAPDAAGMEPGMDPEGASLLQSLQAPTWPSATEAALRSAILRVPHASEPQNAEAPAPGSRVQLERLGLSPDEISLLLLQGVNL
jgi:hypothetical protein